MSESIAAADRTHWKLRNAPARKALERPVPGVEAEAERAAVEARLADTLKRREALPWWRRREREELDRQVEVQLRAARHLRTETEQLRAPSAEAELARARPAQRTEATGRERLRLQAIERAAVVELLATPDPPEIAPALDDIGLEL